MTPFGEKMRALRAVKEVSQAEMAKALDVSAAYLSALEHGNRGAPSFALVHKIIEYFGLIWDDAEDLKEVARLSKPKVSIDTSGLDPRATKAANLLAKKIGRLDDTALDALLTLLSEK
ncbi:MAG: transcriptional regulator [Kordiimonadales bacterium]|nr:MAG: transcriptional regulator [Kordiimonadales bacterium]